VLVIAQANVLFLEPAAGETVCLRARNSGERLYFELPGDLPLLARVLRALGTVRLHFHHVHGCRVPCWTCRASPACPTT